MKFISLLYIQEIQVEREEIFVPSLNILDPSASKSDAIRQKSKDDWSIVYPAFSAAAI